MLGIVDYGMGNIFSLMNAMKTLDIKSTIISKPEKLNKCDAIILPGVGAFGDAMDRLKSNNFVEAINEFKNTGKFILGICLGMQLLTDKSFEFGEHKGLGLVDGNCIRFSKNNSDSKVIIPHTMWNNINLVKKDIDIFANIPNNAYMYFVHSFFTQRINKKEVISWTTYAGTDFCSAFQKDNIIGFQFHPEKSGEQGLNLLNNFWKII